MAIHTDNKEKEVVPPKEQEKGKDVMPPIEVTTVQVMHVQSLATDNVHPKEPPSGKRYNYVHYHDVAGPTNFCKVIMSPQLKAIPMPLDFKKNFPSVAQEFKLKTNTRCSWRVTVRPLNDRVTFDKGWADFASVHQIKICFMVTFKLLTPDMLKVIVFNDHGIEMVSRCGKHHNAFAINDRGEVLPVFR
uniref:TF-B3 domain-containing protein n=1 Tax=Hordeum vulgare subsp. vulgare TaxID=112509 RepID=A0A8I6XFY2_HORVV